MRHWRYQQEEGADWGGGTGPGSNTPRPRRGEPGDPHNPQPYYDPANPDSEFYGEPPPGYDQNRNPTWSSSQPRLFYQIRDLLLEESELELSADAASRALNAYADRFYSENGRHPTWTDVRTDPDALVEMQRSALRTDLLPAVFTVATPEGVIVYENTTAKGPLPVPFAKQPDLQKYLLGQTSAAV